MDKGKPQTAGIASDGQRDALTSAEVARPARRPYVAPVVESGDAFERVQLQSGTGFADPIDCPPQ